MTITELKKQIRHKDVQPFYCFIGEEIGIRNIYIHKMVEFLDATLMVVDKVADTMTSTTNSLLSKRRVFVVYDDMDFLKHEEVWEKFSNGEVLKKDVLILVYNSLDKRTKFYKQYDLSIVEFNRLNDTILSVYVQNEIALSDKNTKILMEICENDYSRIMLEIDKIWGYVNANTKKLKIRTMGITLCDEPSITYDEAFEKLLADGTIYIPPYDAIFDFVDAVLRHKVKFVYNLLEQCKAIGEYNLALISVLYTNAKQMLQVMACPANANIEETTGLTSWQIKCARDRVGFYKIGDLVYIMRVVQDTEKKIKQGIIEDSVAIDYVLASIL